jgi:hypothetical protein
MDYGFLKININHSSPISQCTQVIEFFLHLATQTPTDPSGATPLPCNWLELQAWFSLAVEGVAAGRG